MEVQVWGRRFKESLIGTYANLYQDTSMTTPEVKVKRKVVALLKEMDAYNFFPVMSGYGRSGIPDIIGCYRGVFFAIECKAGDNKTTALQEMQLQKIRDAGGIALIINEENIEHVQTALRDHTGH
jgi:Holliday junction resolvase